MELSKIFVDPPGLPAIAMLLKTIEKTDHVGVQGEGCRILLEVIKFAYSNDASTGNLNFIFLSELIRFQFPRWTDRVTLGASVCQTRSNDKFCDFKTGGAISVVYISFIA